jgi:hypothetical protein
MNDVKGCRALIAAVLDQAFSDALMKSECHERRSARLFINKENKLFRMYCELLDLEPEYVESKMNLHIMKGKSKPMQEFRE